MNPKDKLTKNQLRKYFQSLIKSCKREGNKMSHYVDPKLEIWYLLIEKNTGKFIDTRLIAPEEIREMNQTLNENDSDLVWIKDPAFP